MPDNHDDVPEVPAAPVTGNTVALQVPPDAEAGGEVEADRHSVAMLAAMEERSQDRIARVARENAADEIGELWTVYGCAAAKPSEMPSEVGKHRIHVRAVVFKGRQLAAETQAGFESQNSDASLFFGPTLMIGHKSEIMDGIGQMVRGHEYNFRFWG